MTRRPVSSAIPPAWHGLLSRRDLLRVGAAGIGASLWPAPGPAASSGAGAPARSVILLWMAGGVTHLDSFDPKPEAPAEVRGTLGPIATSVTGVRFCESLPCLARQAHRLSVVRSFSHDSNDHFLSQAYALSGRKVPMSQITTEPNVGAVVARLHGGRVVPGTAR